MLEIDIDENNKEKDELSQDINRFKKAIRRMKQKDRKYRELSSRLNVLKKSKTDIRNKVDALKEIVSHTKRKKMKLNLTLNN